MTEPMTNGQRYRRIGITGSRRGPTDAQLVKLVSVLNLLRLARDAEFLHHGDCVGVDAEAALAARELGYTVVGHPPVEGGKRAFFPSDEERVPKLYLERDRDLVDQVDLLIAVPGTFEPVPRSGTWYTFGYAEGTGVTAAMILPDGSWRR